MKFNIVSKDNAHVHDEKMHNVAAVMTRVACKRKATDDATEQPLKLIRTAVSLCTYRPQI
jgi:hypothetical protein